MAGTEQAGSSTTNGILLLLLLLYQFNSTKKENEKARKALVVPQNVCDGAHVSLLDVQSHLGYPKNVDGRW